jgi:hypothetical protein
MQRLTPEQTHVVEASRPRVPSLLVVGALAGTGKSTTLRHICTSLAGVRVLYLSFSVATVAENHSKLDGICSVSTLHAYAKKAVEAGRSHTFTVGEVCTLPYVSQLCNLDAAVSERFKLDVRMLGAGPNAVANKVTDEALIRTTTLQVHYPTTNISFYVQPFLYFYFFFCFLWVAGCSMCSLCVCVCVCVFLVCFFCNFSFSVFSF